MRGSAVQLPYLFPMKNLEFLSEIVAVALFSVLAAVAISTMGAQEREVVAKAHFKAYEFCWSSSPRSSARGSDVQRRNLQLQFDKKSA